MTVRNCYNRGTVSAGSSGSQAGGIAGSAVQNTEIISCYNTGQVTGSSACQSIAGTNTGTGNILHCFYQNGSPGDVNAKSVTQAGLKTWGAAFALNGGNLDQGTGISWSYDAGKNDGYPYPGVNALRDAARWEEVGEAAFNGLLAGAVPALSGSIYQIGTAEQLAWFAYRVNNVSGDSTLQADLTADIDMSAAESGYVSGGRLNWIPIGKTEALAYEGRFGEGNSRIHEVRNLYVNTDSIAGLFGQLKGNARVIKTGVAGCSVTGNYSSERNGACAGGIAARIADNAVISQCYNRGGSKVTAAGGTGDGRAGGIVGSMNGKSVVEDSYHLDSSVECTGNSAHSGGIAGVVSVAAGEDGKVKNCYHACGPSGSVISSGTAGGITGNFGRADTRTACYSEVLLGTDTNSSSGVKKLGTTDAGRRSDVDGLNTTAAGEREGTDRVWFTSLAGEETRGLPTLIAPEMYQMELSPAAADTGTTVSLGTGISIPDAMLRGIYLKKDNAGSDTIHLTAADTVAGNFHIYGTDNANVNLGLKAGTKDVSGLAQSLTAPTASLDSFSQLTLYTAAAYTHTEDRILLLDVSSGTSRYEIRITIPGVTSKPLKVSLPVSVNMELDPNVGTQPISYSADLELKNLNDYPIKAVITNVEQLSGKDVKLTPIPKTTAIDPFKPLAAAGIRLGITFPLAGADTGNLAGQPDGKIYYIPAGSGSTEKWMAGELGYDKMLRYRYFIEHSRVHGKADQSFGFKILYKFEIPETDNAGVVTVAPAS